MSELSYKNAEDLQQLMDQGMTQAQMAKAFKVSALTVGNWCRKFGLTKASKGKAASKPSSLNRTIRKKLKAKDSSDASAKIRQLLDMMEELPEGSDNVRSAIKADMVDLIRGL